MNDQFHKGYGDNINVEGDAYINTIQKNPSLIADIVNALYPQIGAIEEDDENLRDFKIDQKIKFNQVIKYKAIFNENALYQTYLLAIYTEFEKQGEFRITLFLRYIRNKYLEIRGAFEKSNAEKSMIEVVQLNADEIIEKMRNEMSDDILKSTNFKGNVESATIVLDIIIIDAFMRCKILEKPPVS